jgi:hypothetical protein
MSSGPDPGRPDFPRQSDVHEDAVRAIRLLAAKAAMFILVPLVAVVVAVWWRFG